VVHSLEDVKTTHQCSNGHIFSENPPKYCPECGQIVMPHQTSEAPIPELIQWLEDTYRKAVEGKDTDGIWEALASDGDNIGVHAADSRFDDEKEPDMIVFGKLLGYVGSDQQAGGETGFTIPELQTLADEISAEAAKLGIKGEVKIYLQLYESI